MATDRYILESSARSDCKAFIPDKEGCGYLGAETKCFFPAMRDITCPYVALSTKPVEKPTLDPNQAKACSMYEPLENSCPALIENGNCENSPECANPCPYVINWDRFPIKDGKVHFANDFITSDHLAPDKPAGAKYDSSKPQYSLLPMDLLEPYLHTKPTGEPVDMVRIFKMCHKMVNRKPIKGGERILTQIGDMLDHMAKTVGLAPGCYALQYGCAKYWHNSWREGFGGNYRRLLEAAMRHAMAYMHGKEYDGEALPGFPKGNMHLGAVYFSLMVALNEAHRHFYGGPRWRDLNQEQKDRDDLARRMQEAMRVAEKEI